MIYPQNDFAPFIAAAVAGSAILCGRWVWKKLPESGKLLRLAVTIASIVSIAAVALGVRDLLAQSPRSGYTGLRRDVFVPAAIRSCSARQQTTPAYTEHKITDGQIATYCGCTANGMADIITPEQIDRILASGSLPPDVQQAMGPVRERCQRAALATGGNR